MSASKSMATAEVLCIPLESPDFDLAEFVPYILAALTSYLTGIKSRAVAPFEIALAEWRVLVCLSRHESCSLNDIVDFTGLKQSSLSRIIVRMSKKGLLRHLKRRSDYRYRDIRITEHGRHVCREATAAVQAECDRFLGLLSVPERHALVGAIKKLLSSIPDPDRPAGFSQLDTGDAALR